MDCARPSVHTSYNLGNAEFRIGRHPDLRAAIFRHRWGRELTTPLWAYFNASLANPASNACMLYYNTETNQINLLNDNGTGWTPATLGSATTLQNSQCSLNVATATASSNGNTRTLNVTVTFKPAFVGAKNVYLHSVDQSGTSGWQQLGTWTVTSGAAGTPSTVSVTPSSGSGATQTFNLQYSDTAGAASLQQVWAYFNATLANPASNACMLYYNAANNQINLLNDNTTLWMPAILGSATTLENSQCSLNVATATASLSGSTLTLNVTVTFKPAFEGAKNVYLHAVDVSGANSGWQQPGSLDRGVECGHAVDGLRDAEFGVGREPDLCAAIFRYRGSVEPGTGVGLFQRYTSKSRQQCMHVALRHCD